MLLVGAQIFFCNYSFYYFLLGTKNDRPALLKHFVPDNVKRHYLSLLVNSWLALKYVELKMSI